MREKLFTGPVNKFMLNYGWKNFYSPSICKKSTTPWRSFKNFANFLKDKKIKSGRVLDLGCGYGAESIYLAKQGFNVTGIDINKGAIKFARDRAKKEQVKTRFICADALEYLRDCQNESVDITASASFLHALKKQERQQHIKQLLRVLKPDGYLYLITFSATDPLCQFHCPRRRWMFRKHIINDNFVYFYCHFFTKQELLKHLSNFQILKFSKEIINYPKSVLQSQIIKKSITHRRFYFIFAQKNKN